MQRVVENDSINTPTKEQWRWLSEELVYKMISQSRMCGVHICDRNLLAVQFGPISIDRYSL